MLKEKAISIKACDLFPKGKDRRAYFDLIDEIKECCLSDQPVKIKYVGVLSLHRKAQRMGRAVRTGEPKVIKARRVVTLKPNGNHFIVKETMARRICGRIDTHDYDHVLQVIETFYAKLAELKDPSVPNFKMEIRGFGTFTRSVREPRICRNPKTEERVMSGEKLLIHFKMGKFLKETLID